MHCFGQENAIFPIKGKTEIDLGLGLIERINKKGGPPQVIMTDGEGARKKQWTLSQVFHDTQYNIHHIERAPSARHKDDYHLQGHVGQTDETWPTVGRIDIPDIINL